MTRRNRIGSPRSRWVWLGLVLVLFLAACGGPLGPFAGGRLRGDVGPPLVADWSFAAEETTAQLETRPEDPRSVNVWFATVGARFYVPSSMILGPKDPTKRSWIKQVAKNPRVRIRVDGKVFERVARRVDDAEEFDVARAALERKYEIDVEEREPDRVVWIYRLSAVSE